MRLFNAVMLSAHADWVTSLTVRALSIPTILRVPDAEPYRHSRRKHAPFSARAAIGDAAEGPRNEGNPALQESLVSMVRLQIGREKVKESVEVERQKLQDLADEASAVTLMVLVHPPHLGACPSGRHAPPCSSASISASFVSAAQGMHLVR